MFQSTQSSRQRERTPSVLGRLMSTVGEGLAAVKSIGGAIWTGVASEVDKVNKEYHTAVRICVPYWCTITISLVETQSSECADITTNAKAV